MPRDFPKRRQHGFVLDAVRLDLVFHHRQPARLVNLVGLAGPKGAERSAPKAPTTPSPPATMARFAC